MTIQEAIDHAVAGGYHIYGLDGMDTLYEGANSEYSVWTRKDNESSFIVLTEKTFLDPHFWQALGQTLGWRAACELAISCVPGEDECRQGHGSYWMFQWHCFIQALAEGHMPDTFFAPLTGAQTRSHGTPQRHPAGQVLLSRASLLLLIADSRQHAQHVCEEAAVAQAVAKDRVRMSRLARQRRRHV
jgi:hypothetical protein